jgi:hypothetical protein
MNAISRPFKVDRGLTGVRAFAQVARAPSDRPRAGRNAK